ncbi:24522_t:CDS:2 [Gigaspora margarita]|uniref:24522_t:CDS:1 n=1 Tax=Gigaspora margarita TaxID=4874 RepID=A0ABN7VS91_GIGMA|nr:24522_t:CDS:2 [Gigaspora margarita]
MYKARIVNDNWLPIELPKLKYIWKNNLTCLTIFKAKSLYLEISNLILDWERKDDARALNLVFNKLFNTRIASSLEKLNLFYLNQLIDSNNQCLLSWPEIKFRSGGMTRGRKPKWFNLLEEKVIEKAEERTIKLEWISRQPNQFASSILLLEITNNKRKKEWILSEKGLKDNPEECNQDPPENEQGFKELRSLKSPEKELILQAELSDIAVMGVVVVQVNKKEEVSLKEVLAHTTGWLSSTRAELLAIWIATLISLSKTEVVVKTNSTVSIMNIKLSIHIAMARQWLNRRI